jgi:hypothetical protein
MNGRTPLYLSAALVVIFVGAMLAFQPYSATWPGRAYAAPAQRYIRAAAARDSVELRQLSASPAPAAWALEAGRTHRLDPWQRRVEAWTGERRGDTAEVFVYPSDQACAESPIVFRFVGTGPRAKVLDARTTCTNP